MRKAKAKDGKSFANGCEFLYGQQSTYFVYNWLKFKGVKGIICHKMSSPYAYNAARRNIKALPTAPSDISRIIFKIKNNHNVFTRSDVNLLRYFTPINNRS